MAKKTKLVKASLAAALVTSAVVPVAAAQTPATTTEVSYVIIEQDGKLIKISMNVYSDLLGAGKVPTVKHIVLNNKETFTIDQFSEALGAYNDLNKTLGHLAEKSEPVTPGGVVDGKVENGEIVPDQTSSITVEAMNATGIFMVGQTATLPTTVDVKVTDADGETKTEKGVQVKWDGKISTEEAGSGSIKGKVTIDKVEYEVSYEYDVVETELELALLELEKAISVGQETVDAEADELYYVVSEATDAVDYLSEESTSAEIKDAQKLVDEANKAVGAIETTIKTVEAAIAEATAKAKKAGASADDIGYAGEFDPSYANDEITAAKTAIKAAQDAIDALDSTPQLEITSVSAINATTLKVTFAGKEPVNVTVAELVDGQTKVTFTYEGKTYTATLDKPYEAPITELVVKSVTAVNTTIKAEANQKLPIKVNGSKEVTVEELKAAGYTVDFKYNKPNTTIYNSKTGVVNGASAATEFKYQVVVTPKEGAAIESNWADVKVVKASDAVKVTQVGLSNKLSYVTLGESVTLEVQKAINAFGEELKEADLPAIDSVVSSDPTVAYVDGNKIVTRSKEGKVTFTVKFAKDSKLEDVTLTVEVKAAQKATSINAKDVKIEKIAVGSTIELSEYYDVLDQYGEKMRTDLQNVDEEVTNSKGEVVTSLSKEDVYTVVVKLSDGTKLGSFTITTVDVAEKEVDEFKLTPEEDFEIDINPDLETTKDSANINVEAYIEGVKLSLSNVASKLNVPDTKFELRTSDKNVVTIGGKDKAVAKATDNKLVGVKAGKATISLVKIEGDLETVVATYEVEVKNTVKLITAVNFIGDAKAVTVTDERLLIADVALATDLEMKHIEKVEYVEANDVVVVTVKNTYGGKEFVLAAEKVGNEETSPDTATVVGLVKALNTKVALLGEKTKDANDLLRQIEELEGQKVAVSSLRVASLTGILAAQETPEQKLNRLKAELKKLLSEIAELKTEVDNLVKDIGDKLTSASASEEEKALAQIATKTAQEQAKSAETTLEEAKNNGIEPEVSNPGTGKPENPEVKPELPKYSNITFTFEPSVTTGDIATIDTVKINGTLAADSKVTTGDTFKITFGGNSTVTTNDTITVAVATKKESKDYEITYIGNKWVATSKKN